MILLSALTEMDLGRVLLAWEPLGPTAQFSLLGSEFAASPSSFHRRGPWTMLYGRRVRQVRPKLHPFSLTTPGELRKTMNEKETCLSFHPRVCTCALTLRVSTHPPTHLHIHSSIYIHLLTYPSVYSSICPSTHPSFSLAILPS